MFNEPRSRPRKKESRLTPRGISREEAADYVGVSPTKFDELVRDRRMPGPRAIDSRRVWCRIELDEAFDLLPKIDRAEDDPWRNMAA